ncbi:hypothetical protein FNV43_RR25442 [Rhamnella rubrinervis]|uniref:FMR1-interacting protein 1 conserved domain-containing protein n=1 Tax=Rhamnella rubrinervis TaxID=2594499 RepID=A0A8K0DU70_9ROSA|nr:hypothetical protein FNV43_RR25442 [Rhamnella rubrinervis]
MRPFYSSFPQHSNQGQPSASSAPPPQQNFMAIQPQFHGSNPHIPIPFSNSSNFLSNGHGMPMPNVPPSMVNQPGYTNAPNPLHLLQNNHLGRPQLGSVGHIPQPGQPHVNNMNNMNSVAAYPVRGQVCNMVQNVNQVNPSQFPGQAFGHNMSNLPQQLNQSMPFGQFCMPNVDQLLALQLLNASQFVPNNTFGFMNQASQGTIPQNTTFSANPQFGNVQCNQVGQQLNQNQHKFVRPMMDVNALKPSPIATQRWQGNSPVQPEKVGISQPSPLVGSQGYPTKVRGVNVSNSNWRNPSGKGFTRNQKKAVQQRGSQNSQFHQKKNGRKKFGVLNGHKGKGLSNQKAGKRGIINSSNQGREQRRFLCFPSSEKENEQWREDRRKNFPSKANIEKKLATKLLNKEVFEREAQIRREQLREILNRQKELGVLVEESQSLLDLKEQKHGTDENRGPLPKNGRLKKNFGKRLRYSKTDRLTKKQRLHDNGSSDVSSLNQRKPTLLQKLLDADVRRDKRRLLQAFRFMMLNSFFKDWPKKPLNFPSVIVKESGCGDNVVEEMSLLGGKYVSELGANTMVERVGDLDDKDGDDDDDNSNEAGSEDENDDDVQEEGEIIN